MNLASLFAYAATFVFFKVYCLMGFVIWTGLGCFDCFTGPERHQGKQPFDQPSTFGGHPEDGNAQLEERIRHANAGG